jgi:hypothetical protein
MGVFESDEQPTFSYTIGLTEKYDHPERETHIFRIPNCSNKVALPAIAAAGLECGKVAGFKP